MPSQKQLEEEKANFSSSVAEVRVRRGGKSQLQMSVAAEHIVILVKRLRLGMNVGARLTFSYSDCLGSQPREWCRPQ